MRIHKQHLAIDIKPVTGPDIVLLERYLPFGPPEKHAERFGRQQQGQVVYLVAWHDAIPIGHALLKWRGAEETQVASVMQGTCPDVEDLFVVEGFRSQGVGRRILEKAEQLARERQFVHIGLSVDVNNPHARALYRHLGYRSAGVDPVHEHGEYVDTAGSHQTWDEVCVYLTKSL